MNSCDDVRAQLPLFVGGDLEAAQVEAVRAHLGHPGLDAGSPASGGGSPGRGRGEGCAACGRILEELQQARQSLLSLHERSPAPALDLWPELSRRLVAEGLLVPRPATTPAPLPRGLGRVVTRRPAGRLLLWQRVASAVAAGALVVLGLQTLRNDSSPSPDAPATVDGGGTGSAGGDLAYQDLQGTQTVLPVAGPGGLHRLEEGEEPLNAQAVPFVDWMNGWPGLRTRPGMPGVRVDPSRPTFASDRSLR